VKLRLKKDIKAEIKRQRTFLNRKFKLTSSSFDTETIIGNIESLQWVLENYEVELVQQQIDEIADSYQDEHAEEIADLDFEQLDNIIAAYEWTIGDREEI